MGIDKAWLEKTLFGRELTADEFEVLTTVFEVSKATQGATIVTQGQEGGVLHLIYSGTAVVRADVSGPVDVADLGPGSVVGYMSFLTDDAASASVIATGDCVLYNLTRAAFTSLMYKYDDLAFAIFAYILRQTAAAIRNMNVEHVRLLHYITGSRMG